MKTANNGILSGADHKSNNGESTSLESIGEHPSVEVGTGKRAAAKAGCGEG